MTWEVWHDGTRWAELEMGMPGEHNALNATAAAALALHRGVPMKAIATALREFKSVKRRLEVRAEVGGVTIIEDFAHHPTAIRETLKTLRAVYPQARLWAILEPRSNTLRRKVLAGELVASLQNADRALHRGQEGDGLPGFLRLFSRKGIERQVFHQILQPPGAVLCLIQQSHRAGVQVRAAAASYEFGIVRDGTERLLQIVDSKIYKLLQVLIGTNENLVGQPEFRIDLLQCVVLHCETIRQGRFGGRLEIESDSGFWHFQIAPWIILEGRWQASPFCRPEPHTAKTGQSTETLSRDEQRPEVFQYNNPDAVPGTSIPLFPAGSR